MANLPASVSLLGAGAWGTALACLLANNINTVRLWGRDRDELANIARARVNHAYLPGVKLPQNLQIEPRLDALVNQSLGDDNSGDAHLNFVIALPSHAFADMLAALRECIPARRYAETTIVWGTKGFAPGGKLLSELVAAAFPRGAHAAISGPSFAAETARLLPTALTVACGEHRVAQAIADWFRGPTTRVYFSDDIIGVQLGGAIKNVLAIAAGVSDGLGFGANARAALITRGLAELTRLGVAFGGRAATFSGLTGVGDLILTCTDDQSRNRRFGLGLGRGQSVDATRRDIGRAIEGINSARELHNISRARGVDMPITEKVFRIIHAGRDPRIAVRELLQRDAKAETLGD